ncbi:MAG: hypothetical protein J6X20_03065 [Bacteroidales bacterium]|nr:hypothetical protein [Bacteroidales bacterium]
MLPIVWAASFFASCENDMATINRIVNPEEEPVFSGTGVTILYSDSAYLKIKVEAPVIERFSETDPPETVFKEGVHAVFYNRDREEESALSADWARLDEKTEIWEARGHVVVSQVGGDSLLTEVIFWNQQEGIIYNNTYTQIFSEGTYYQCNEGIRAAQNFSWWSCTSSAGEIEFEDVPFASDTLVTEEYEEPVLREVQDEESE